MKIQKEKKKSSFGGGGGGGVRMNVIAVFVKIQKKIFFEGGGGVGGVGLRVRVDVNREVKFLWIFKKKLGEGRVWSGGLGGGWGQGGCER